MKKGLKTFEQVMKDRKRAKRIARRGIRVYSPYKWVEVKTAKPKWSLWT